MSAVSAVSFKGGQSSTIERGNPDSCDAALQAMAAVTEVMYRRLQEAEYRLEVVSKVQHYHERNELLRSLDSLEKKIEGTNARMMSATVHVFGQDINARQVEANIKFIEELRAYQQECNEKTQDLMNLNQNLQRSNNEKEREIASLKLLL